MRLALLCLLVLTGCQQVKKDGTVCPEYRDIRCVGGAKCSMNKERGCKVCVCEDMLDGRNNQQNPDDTTRPPDVPPPGGEQ